MTATVLRRPAARPGASRGAWVLLVAALLFDPRARSLAGAEVAVGSGWLGLRSHPRPAGSVVFAEPRVPDWFDALFEEMIR